jgi:prepilin-type N-terminal cleavage/methylation domain-containing protein
MNRRGFSLIELMLALAITSVVVAGISLVLLKQSQASVKQTQQRTLEETGRQALLEIASAVRLAGAGIDPTAAFDFDRYGCGATPSATQCNNNAGLDGTAAVPGRRDRTDGPDELVVSYRDPVFFRVAKSITGSNPYLVTFDGVATNPNPPLKTTIKKGRIAMLLCSGADPVAYMAFAADAAPGDTTVSLRTVTNSDGYYPQTNPTENCYNKATLALVERVRYFVANDFDGVPALFRDRGRTGDPQVLFRGIEDLQLAYQIGSGTAPGGPPASTSVSPPPTPPACGATSWVFGACNGTAETPSEGATAPDWINDGYDTVRRYSGHPANIRAVQITLVARSTQSSPDKAGDPPAALLPPATLANRAAPPPDPGGKKYVRSVLSMTEQTPNLLARARVLPNAGFSTLVAGTPVTEVLR